MGNAAEKRKRAAIHNAEREAAKDGRYDDERMNLLNPVMGVGKRLQDDVAFAWMRHMMALTELGKLELAPDQMMEAAWANAQCWLDTRSKAMGLDELPEDRKSVIVTAQEGDIP